MKEIKIGFLGCGNIGVGVYKVLQENGAQICDRQGLDIKIAKILVRDVHKKRAVDIEASLFTDHIADVLDNPDIQLVAEFMGGEEPARQYILAALEKGKSVVTANKEVMAKHGPELERMARKTGAELYYEASVAGGIPVIKVLRESLQANQVQEIMGIINGTTNFILTKMSEEGREFSEVLKEAQQLGYAEPDPTADIEGFDAMYKLSILSSLAFHSWVPLEKIHREGITRISAEDIAYGKELGLVLKLLAIAKKNGSGIEARVHPTFIHNTHPLAAVRESYNAIFIQGDAVGNLMLYGRGAGDLPTGSAIVSDIVTAGQKLGETHPRKVPKEMAEKQSLSFEDNWKTGFFVRLTVKDQPGVLAKISGVFGQYKVSIASVIQKEHGMDFVPLIFVIHHSKEQSMRLAMKEIEEIDDVIRVENVIRVER